MSRIETGTQLMLTRTAAGMTQEQLAAQSGVHVKTIKRLERAGDDWISCAHMQGIEGALIAHGVEPVKINNCLGVIWRR